MEFSVGLGYVFALAESIGSKRIIWQTEKGLSLRMDALKFIKKTQMKTGAKSFGELKIPFVELKCAAVHLADVTKQKNKLHLHVVIQIMTTCVADEKN